MNLLMGLLAALGKVTPSITGTPNFGGVVAATVAHTSATMTVTVPSGSSGVVRFNFGTDGPNDPQYKINGGSSVTVVDGVTVTLANGDTVQIFWGSNVPGTTCSLTMYDNVTNTTVGTYYGERT